MKPLKYFNSKIIAFLVFAIISTCVINSAKAQRFNCNRDRLHSGTVRFSTEPSGLIIGQRCEISVFDSRGRKVNDRDFSISSDNRHVKISGLAFHVDSDIRGEPWLHVNGELIEEDGNITIRHNECNQSYSFPFRIRQSYVFDRDISCKGERREFAIAPYRNMVNKNLYAVLLCVL